MYLFFSEGGCYLFHTPIPVDGGNASVSCLLNRQRKHTKKEEEEEEKEEEEEGGQTSLRHQGAGSE